MILLITYDLNKIGKDYARLYDAIKDLGDWMRDPGLDSVWFVNTHLTPAQVEATLTKVIDENDRLFITKLHPGLHSGWMHKDVWPWISSRA